MPEIIYQTKKELYPRFGYALPSEQIVYVRGDLPNCVRRFVTEHELYHLRDKSKWWVWREIRANIAGALRHPFGFIVCAMISLAPYRLKYYWKRFIGEVE